MAENVEVDQDLVRTLEFLAQTKEGTYSKVELTSIRYARLRNQRSDFDSEDGNYYYSVS
jgi:hypothetical protein